MRSQVPTGAIVLLCVLSWLGGAAGASPADRCIEAGTAAGARHGVPAEVMHAIALVETGRTRQGRFEPWPWTINVGGDGSWLDTAPGALAAARAAVREGRRNFDVGCFQLNYRWHHEHFSSLEAMFDPAANADYAARYLLGHFERTRDWATAAGQYHSRTPEYSARYAARFRQIIADLPVTTRAPAPQTTTLAWLPASAGSVGGGALLRPATPLFSRARGALVGEQE